MSEIDALRAEVARLRAENQRLEKSIDWLVSKRFPCPRDGSQCYKEIAIRNDTTYAENVCEQHWRDAAYQATAGHIAASSSDVVRADLEEIIALRAEVARSREREEWLVTQLAEGGEWFCPMDDNYRCEWRSGDLCEMKSSKSREQCWSKAADMATRENPGNSGEVPENPGEGKAK